MTPRNCRMLRVAFGLVALVGWSGCAAMPPERAVRRELLWTAAQACRDQYPFVVRLDFDRFDRLFWLYREGTSQSDRQAFSACYQQTIEQLTKAAARSPVPPAAAAPAAIGSPSASGPPRPIASALEAPPALRPGSEWTYRWQSPRGSGTFVWRLDREEAIDGVEHYVVRSGTTREIFWRKLDGASVMEKVSGVVVLRHLPPRPNFRWPLRVGTTWELLYVIERPVEQETVNTLRTWRVEAFEPVHVTAGTFGAFKIVSRDKWADRVATEYWYAPDVRNVVQSRDYYSYGVETRELMTFKLGT